MTMSDPWATPLQPEDAVGAPALLQASTLGYDETTMTPGATTYGTAYDAPAADPYAQQGHGVPGPDANVQGACGAEACGQPGYEQAAYAAGQQAYGQPAYGQPVCGQPFAVGAPKQWVAALLLAFFLDALSIHSFYLGYTTKGIIQSILTITMTGTPTVAIWAFIEFIMIIARSGSYAYDAQGQPLQ